jgi:Ca2+-binding EF-hand superfamily protein
MPSPKDKEELTRGLLAYGISDISQVDLNNLFSYFDKDGSGKISVDELLYGLKGGMSYERKHLVRLAWEMLDVDGWLMDLFLSTTMTSHTI